MYPALSLPPLFPFTVNDSSSDTPRLHPPRLVTVDRERPLPPDGSSSVGDRIVHVLGSLPGPVP